MQSRTIRYCGLVAAGLLLAGNVQAFDFGNMMNPSKWMGGKDDDDRYYDDYGPGPGYGYPGTYGPGYGAPGYGDPAMYGAPGYAEPGYGAPVYGAPGYGTPGGYGSPGYSSPGYGTPGYGAPGYTADPGYGWSYGPEYNAPATAPAPKRDTGSAEEIKRLKERIRQLEQSTQPHQPVWGQPGYQYR